MDVQEAKRIMRLVADDDSSFGRAWDDQEKAARLILDELKRVEKENEKLQSTLKKPNITVEVSGGMVQNVYTTLGINLEVDVLDFDDNGDRADEERDDLIEYLKRVVAGQQQIY